MTDASRHTDGNQWRHVRIDNPGLTQPVPASLRECFFDFFEALNSGFLCEITTCFQVRGGMG